MTGVFIVVLSLSLVSWMQACGWCGILHRRQVGLCWPDWRNRLCWCPCGKGHWNEECWENRLCLVPRCQLFGLGRITSIPAWCSLRSTLPGEEKVSLRNNPQREDWLSLLGTWSQVVVPLKSKCLRNSWITQRRCKEWNSTVSRLSPKLWKSSPRHWPKTPVWTPSPSWRNCGTSMLEVTRRPGSTSRREPSVTSWRKMSSNLCSLVPVLLNCPLKPLKWFWRLMIW